MNLFSNVSLRRLLLVVLVLAAALTRAGQYVVTYSGGQVDNLEDGSSTPFTNHSDSYFCPYRGANFAGAGAHAHGPITASLDWQGNDSPPSQVIVYQDAAISEMINGGGGYSDPSQIPFTTGFSGEIKGSNYLCGYTFNNAQCTQYQVVQNPGRHITVPLVCNLDYEEDDTGGDEYVLAYYAVAERAVSLSLSGGIVDPTTGAQSLLIGQHLAASITPPEFGNPWYPSSSGTTPAYQWSLSGNASPFKSFGVTKTTIQGTQGVGTDYASLLTPLAASDYNAASLGCSFAQPGAGTVTCAVHFAVPSGDLPAAGLDMTLTAPVAIVAPKYVQPMQIAKGTVTLVPATSATSDDAALGLSGSNGSGYQRPQGIEYRSEIVTPTEYAQTDAQGHAGGDVGGFVWIQLVQFGTTRTLADGTQQTEAIDAPNVGTWTFGLDALYPFEPTSLTDHTVSESSVGKMYIADGGGLTVADDGTVSGTVTHPCESDDTPSEPLHNQDAQTGSQTATSYHIREDFTVVQLYKAPGSDSQFVPVQSFHWFWGGDCNHGRHVTPADLGPDPIGPSPDGGSFVEAMFDFPSWFVQNSVHDDDTITPLASVGFPSWAHASIPSFLQYVPSGSQP